MAKASARVVRRKKTGPPKQLNQYFATTFKGAEKALLRELDALGAKDVRQAARGASFKGTLKTLYKVNLWSRTAHRVLWEIAKVPCRDKDALYEGIRTIDWNAHLDLGTRFAVDTVGTNDKLIHTKFSSLVIKDGIVDWFRDGTGKRPNVDTERPDVRISARISRNECTVSWDTSGERLHRRGYRGKEITGPAPLKENLAAAMLLMAGYDGSTPLIDPMCGTGTILVEGAMIAENRAPGLMGRQFALTRHPTFEANLWDNLKDEAQNAIIEDPPHPIFGYDVSDNMVRMAKAAATGAGVDSLLRIKRLDVRDLRQFDSGMIVTNPPYGKRLDNTRELVGLYGDFGDVLRRNCQGTTVHLITSSDFLADKMNLKPYRSDTLWNGPLECHLFHYRIQ